MSDFIESEAEESENDFSGEEEDTAPKHSKKKKKMVMSDDDDEDEEGLDEDLKDLIDDNPIEEEGDEESEDEEEVDGEKRKHRDSDIDEDLSDEDYDLIQENLGIKIKRKAKRKRIRMMSDDEDSDKEADKEQNEREVIEKELFEGEDDEEPREQEERPQIPDTIEEDLEHSGEESDDSNFIVDEDDQPINRQKKKRKHIHDDAALQEAQDIFGVDFDFDEFEHYGEYDEEEEDEEDEYEEEEMEESTSRKKKGQRKRTTKTTIFEVFEPSELERGHFTDLDQEIRMSDMPERFQLRRLPVCSADDAEIKEEAQWIFKYAFTTAPLSQQDYFDGGLDPVEGRPKRPQSTVGKICDALNFMRNQQFEVPFIAFYRKEYVEPELNINDLWKIYRWDEKWMQLRNRRQAMVSLFEKMQVYQFEQIEPDKPLPSDIRTLSEEDLDRARMVQSMEELKDVYQHFLLYYGHDIPKMKNSLKKKKKKKKLKPVEPINVEEGEEGEGGEKTQEMAAEEEEEEEEEHQEVLKQATRKSGYNICAQAGLAELARKFGLTPEQFGQNLRDNYQRYDVEQDPTEPNDLARDFINSQFKTEEEVLKGAVHMVAMQLAAEPLVRQALRQVYHERGKISCHPTKKGMKEVDENHPCYAFKYLRNKPVNTIAYDQFLKIETGKQDGLLEYEIHIDDKKDPSSVQLQTYFEEMKPLYHRDEFSHLVQEWNNLRSQALERAFTQVLYPQMTKELVNQLLDESREHIVRACCLKLYNWLKVAPYQVDQQLADYDDDYDTSKGIRVLGLAFSQEREEPAFCALVDGDGEVTDFLRLVHILKRRNAYRKEDREGKESDMKKLKDFIATKKPHVIAVSAEAREAQTLIEDIQQLVNDLEQEQQIAPISIELVDNELAIVYMNSKKSTQDFRDYPPLLRQAVSIARRLQDPLIEFCQLCNPDEDILALKFHVHQDTISKEELLEALYLEFINRVNEVGVDVNRCVTNHHTALLVQFVCGLGPRKGFHLLRILKQNNSSRLENRTQLVTMCHMGPKVFINCAGFIKIDTNSLGESTDTYVEVLDGSRVHPETYEWARKMAVDALDYDDTTDDGHPAGALDEILRSPERLKDLDLDAFAEELERQGYGNKHITLYDIRAELNHRYKDLRTPYRPPTQEEKFNMLTKENPTTFYIGKLIQCRVTGFAHRRPKGEQLDQANPRKNDETGLWQCPFCQKNDFPEISDVWNHFDAGDCPGQAMGVKTRLDNGCTGYIPMKFLSDSHVTNPEDRVQMNMQLHCRIMKIDITRFNTELTSRSSDLKDKDNKWKLPKDEFYDQDAEDVDIKAEEDKKKSKAKQSYVTRVIAHPSFKNIDYRTCEKLMADMEQGEVIIRPSSKGTDRLTVTWKVTDGIMQHIDVREEGKENAFSLGSSLWIDNQEFEDLDEIIARYIQPMAAFARDILNYKYYMEADGGKKEITDKFLVDEKKKAPSKIPYIFSASTQYPGKFLLGYLPRKPTIYEYATVTPEGIRYRGQVFHSLNSLIRWFKEHFRDPVPGVGTPASIRTPLGMTSQINQTPSMNLGKLDSAAIQRAAAGLPSSVYNTLAQVAGQTPGFPGQGFSYGAGFNFQSGVQTPLMQQMLTPQYGTPGQNAGGTPSQSIGTPSYTPTPRASWSGATPSGMTPRHQPGGMTPQHRSGGMTPQHRSGGMTPQHRSGGMTPQHRSGGGTPRNHPGMTPQHRSGGVTPRHHGGMTPQHRSSGGVTPRQGGSTPRTTPRSSSNKPAAATDWAKAAEMWRKQMESGSRTPGKSPAVNSTAGDATPLFDEL